MAAPKFTISRGVPPFSRKQFVLVTQSTSVALPPSLLHTELLLQVLSSKAYAGRLRALMIWFTHALEILNHNASLDASGHVFACHITPIQGARGRGRDYPNKGSMAGRKKRD